MISITLPLPPSANKNWRVAAGGRIVKSNESVRYADNVGWLCRARGIEPLEGKIGVMIDVYSTTAARDLDNSIKCLLDSLNGFAWADDRQIYEICATKHIDAKNPRVELTARVIE